MEKLSNKQKLYLLAGAFLIASIMVYSFSIKKTVSLSKSCKELSKKLELAANAPEQMASLEQKLEQIQRKLGSNETHQANFQQLIFEKTSAYCHAGKPELKEINEPLLIPKNDYVVEIQKLILQGSFSELNAYIYELEQKNFIGKILSVNYHVKNNIKTKEIELLMDVYLQNLKKHDNE